MTPLALESAEECLQINRSCLDQELADQPSMFSTISMEYVTHLSVRDECKEAVERLEKQVEVSTRRAAAETGTKMTESAIASEVKLNADVIKARDAYLDAKEKAERWGVLREAMLQRAHVLKDLAHLATSEYTMDASVVLANRQRSEAVHQQRTAEVKSRRRQIQRDKGAVE